MTKSPPEFVGVVHVVVEPKTEADRTKLLAVLAERSAADTGLRYTVDDRTGEIKLVGIDELQIDQKIRALRSVHHVEMNVGAPQVAYRETIERKTEIDYTHKKLRGGYEYARVMLTVAPQGASAGNSFVSKIESSVLPPDYVAGVERGAWSALEAGVIEGFPVIDVRVILVDGAYHETDSSPLAFEIAARTAVREALARAPVLLEPIMMITILTPGDDARLVVDDLKLRRGHVQEQKVQDRLVVILATVPLTNMFGYSDVLRRVTKGRASYTIQFDHYAPVPSPDDPTFRPAVGMRV